MKFRMVKFFCETCEWQKIYPNLNSCDLKEFPRSEIQGKIPKINPETKKTEVFESFKQPKKFKCPNCGRLVTPKTILDKQAIDNEKARMLKAEEEARIMKAPQK